MSTQLMKKISGQLTDVQNNPLGPIPFGITVAFTRSMSSDSPGGWIGSSPVDLNTGTFEFMTAYAMPGSETVNYKILRDNIVIQEGSVSIENFQAGISLTADVYNNMFVTEPAGYATIRGKVTLGEEEIAAAPLDPAKITVFVEKPGFRSTTILGESNIDAYGRYEVKVLKKLIQETGRDCSPATMENIRASVQYQQTADHLIMITTSDQAQPCCDGFNIDLNVDDISHFALFQTESAQLLQILSEVSALTLTDLQSIATDAAGNELPSLAAVTKLAEDKLGLLVIAAKAAQEADITLDHAYALSHELGADVQLWAQADLESLQSAIGKARAHWRISTAGDINVTYDKLQELRETLLANVITGNGQTMIETLAVTGCSDETLKEFISLTAEHTEKTPGAFWDIVAAALPEEKEQLQRGIQALTACGMQPEVAQEILRALSTEENGEPGDAQPFNRTALWDQAKWMVLIEDACTKHDALCVPLQVIEAAQEAATDPKVLYATQLESAAREFYPHTVLNEKLKHEGALEPVFGSYSADIRTYFRANPLKDLRFNSAFDIAGEANLPLSGDNTVEGFREALSAMQNVLRITAGKPDAAAALLQAGVKSSTDVAQMTQEQFTSNYAEFLGGEHIAQQIHAKSTQTAAIVGQLQVQYSPANIINAIPSLGGYTSSLWETFLASPGTSESPDLQTLFGSMDLCSCSECMSMYSPAAYYTDILNFMRTKLKIGSSTISLPYNELLRRRPDLLHIDLSCKNANTPLPYVDLVNEQLELMIARKVHPTSGFPKSYQTSATAKELEAYPEHTEKGTSGEYAINGAHQLVYDDTLKSADYPAKASFDLALEESRVYLEHLGYSRSALMETFRPLDYNNSTVTEKISEYNHLSEKMGLSRRQANIIAGTAGVEAHKMYGFTDTANANGIAWYNQLCNDYGATAAPNPNPGLRLLLERADISYIELLQLLETDFLSPLTNTGDRTFEIIAATATSTSNDQDTCDLSKLKIIYTGSGDPGTEKLTFFTYLYRFIRLQRATKWSIYQLDMVLKSLNVVGLNWFWLRVIANIFDACSKLNVAPEHIAGLWRPLSTRPYINFNGDSQAVMPSLYESIFQNKNVSNPPNTLFANPQAWSTQGTTVSQDHKPVILSACNMTEEELDAVFARVNDGLLQAPDSLTLDSLSAVYGVSQLAKGLRISVKDLLRVSDLSGFGFDFSSDPGGVMKTLANAVMTATKSIFSLDELEYLFAHKDTQGSFTPVNEDIALFYTNLRGELKKLTADSNTMLINGDQIGNVILRQFSTTFNLSTSTVKYLLEDVLNVGTSNAPLFLSQAVSNPTFINSTDEIEASGSAALYQAYIRLNKIAVLVNRFKLSTHTVKAIQVPLNTSPQEPAPIPTIGILGLIRFDELPTAATANTSQSMQQLVHMQQWVKVRDTLRLKDEELTTLWKKLVLISNGATLSDFLDQLAAYSDWTPELLEYLCQGVDNILNVSDTTPANFASGALILQIAEIVNASKRAGMAPELMYPVLTPGVIVTHSQKVRQAAKAKHSDAAWQKIAKPLQDALREQQRKALVAYVVAHPELADLPGQPVNGTRWKNENELYAYLLMDVEMTPCMKTSRIKQAISSVQLFLDRVILNLENANGNLSSHIYMTTEQTQQWKTWRKWYRVWEANRKIFLYPENWIEPELRDDKTPFFKELETQVLQDDITDATAEEALREYLEKVDEVARLEPVSAYHQVEPATNTEEAIDIMHVFARTQAQPHRYFYRKLEDDQWSPWEKVAVSIKGDHIVPVVWNRRVYLFWLEFTQKTTKRAYNPADTNLWVNTIAVKNGNPGILTIVTDGNEDDKKVTLDARLSWSQYKDGKWLASETCNDVMNINPSRIRLTNEEAGSYNAVSGDALRYEYFSALSANGEQKITDVFRNRLYMTPHFGTGAEDGALILSVNFLGSASERGAITLQSFIFPEPSGKPVAEKAWERELVMLSPLGTRATSMKFREIAKQTGNIPAVAANFGKLSIGSVKTYLDRHFSYYYEGFKSAINVNTNTIPNTSVTDLWYRKRLEYGTAKDTLLNDTPMGSYTLTAFASVHGTDLESCIKNYFFFEDDKNTFFVRRINYMANVIQAVAQGNSTPATMQAAGGMFSAGNGPNNAGTQNGGSVPAGSVGSVTLQPDSYRFETFYHAQIHNFMKSLNKGGVSSLLNLNNQSQTDNIFFGTPGAGDGHYKPTVRVHNKVPKSNVQFKANDAYSMYNWEIFFHTPMLMAQRLSENQRFEEAQKWYHYIFNPTSSTGLNNVPLSDKRRFWKFYPFYEEAAGTPQTLQQLLAAIAAQVTEAENQVKQWEKHPFQPHVIARLRILAYMKNVVMKYIDNLIAWGDQLFRRDTIESINEGTQLYILAANILGTRPENIPPRAKREDYTFDELLDTPGGIDSFANATVAIEAFFGPNTGVPTNGNAQAPEYGKMQYFCLTKNDKLMGYWDTVADRLYKIRNCMNIDGVVRQLPLYEPPIDPALLVRATAMGLDINSLLDLVSSGSKPSYYRFGYMLQKANEFCNEVRGLGSSLLSTLEKKDAEHMALLRSGHELQMMSRIRFIKEGQVQEAEANLESMQLTKENTQTRYNYYSSRPFMNTGEQTQMQSMQTGLVLQAIQGGLESSAGILGALPNIHVQGFATGVSATGQNFSSIARAISSSVGIAAGINNAKGSMAGTVGSYERRRDDWNFQAESALKELEQLDRQILAAEIRLDNARKELDNHDEQVANTLEVDQYMRSKFSNKELYSWMAAQISDTYFQSYQLAYDLALKAEACYKYDLPFARQAQGGFITFGHWDSLRKGLMSGEKLQLDLRKMEVAYMEENKRELELSKSFSLVLNDPSKLLELRENGVCTFKLHEELFDLDYPGHYLRRIKSVSVSLPCIAGPYTTVAATLTLSKSATRMTDAVGDLTQVPYLPAPSIATSGAQNDSGVFELNFRDERYLPFEGLGAVDSEWELRLIHDDQVRMFDFSTISDVILHVKYTAQEGGATLRGNRIVLINNILNGQALGNSLNGNLLPRYFSLKHEFGNTWHSAFQAATDEVVDDEDENAARTFTFNLERKQFPYFTGDKAIVLSGAEIQLSTKSAIPDGTTYKIIYNGVTTTIAPTLPIQPIVNINLEIAAGGSQTSPISLTLYKESATGPELVTGEDLSDLYFVLQYKTVTPD